MSNFRRTIVVSDDLSAYRFRVRQRTLLEKLRYLQSKTKQTELHIGENDWKIINAALLEQSNQRRSLHNVTLVASEFYPRSLSRCP